MLSLLIKYKQGICKSSNIAVIEENINLLKNWLIENLTNYNNCIWSQEIYADCYAMRGLLEADTNIDILEKAFNWIISKQNKNGSWEEGDRRETTSLVIIILIKYYVEKYSFLYSETLKQKEYKKQLLKLIEVFEGTDKLNISIKMGVSKYRNKILISKNIFFYYFITILIMFFLALIIVSHYSIAREYLILLKKISGF